ncbi:SGNH/GDSL hydrolase family protein [Microbacterium sp. NIBRBAC000506063]|uniref:SGNH/GDSL hydrolase family protein n=1 Tax=Microbacterium sp. NIBRBAC000506063 TaxID=2734618 RepID=UPI001BB6310B|nr:SGNH/GDSL hydrolase family protein [Microbacterium sp. NIBRBAC000506063]QTV79500.1 SGNH/GDSL hydrolase family protein [Microbacterium sp. NIBRBAC000506063]
MDLRRGRERTDTRLRCSPRRAHRRRDDRRRRAGQRLSARGALRQHLRRAHRRARPRTLPDLVIVQGSINDRRLGTSGYREAVTDAWDALSALYPDAAIVVLGPAPHALPVAKGTARIDRDLGELAAARGWWYISPVEREWITEGNYLAVIDVDEGRRHPSDDGHRYLAEQVASALAELAAPAPAASAQ